VLNAGKATMGNGQPTELGELGQLGKQLVSKVPNSGTAYRHLLIGTGLGGIGGLIGHETRGDSDNTEQDILGGASVPAAMMLAGLANRGANSRLVTKYFAARAPQIVQDTMDKITSGLPAAAVRTAQVGQLPGSQETPETESTPGGMADGGQPHPGDPPIKKSTFWDLVQQGWHELTGPSDVQAPKPVQNQGTQASGTVGNDFDKRIDQSVADQT
jgi:hypothetical protein